jgi:hypothetical protein
MFAVGLQAHAQDAKDRPKIEVVPQIRHSGWVRSVAFSPDGRQVLSVSFDGTTRIWNRATGELAASLLATPQGEWLAVTPEGFFGASAKGTEMLSVVRGLEAFGIDQFYQALYRPDLVQEKLAGDPSGKVREAAAKLDLGKLIASGRVPAIRLVSHQAEQSSATDVVTIEASLADRGGGIGRAEWRINGIIVGVVDRPGVTPEAEDGARSRRQQHRAGSLQ